MIITTGQGAAADGIWRVEARNAARNILQSPKQQIIQPQTCPLQSPSYKERSQGLHEGSLHPKAHSVFSKRVPEPPSQAPSVYPKRWGLDVCFLNKQPR